MLNVKEPATNEPLELRCPYLDPAGAVSMKDLSVIASGLLPDGFDFYCHGLFFLPYSFPANNCLNRTLFFSFRF